MSSPTNILYLPVVGMQITAANNADWLDGLEYWDAEPPAGNPIDLAGIQFEFDMRVAAPVATVVLRCSTGNGLIRVYANSWQLIVPAETMLLVPPGDFVFDVLAHADGYTRNIATAEVNIQLGVTRSGMRYPGIMPAAVATSIVRVDGVAHVG